MSKRIPFLRQHPLQMPNRNHNRMQLIHTATHPLPQRLLRLPPTPNLRRTTSLYSTRTTKTTTATRYRLHIQRNTHTLHTLTLILINQTVNRRPQLT
ncbi:hypothetical protein HanRHA438_Chr16g0742201 [Helianthus annuus]|nr:hypothetical protein HanRHA438_Chr16g0742201 [Helianthus annuus]